MKKKALLLGLVLSTAAFGFGKDDFGNRMTHKREEQFHEKRMEFFENLTQEQKDSIGELKLKNMKENSNLKLSVEEKTLQIKKLMSEDKVNWTKVKKLTEEIADLEGQIRFNDLKTRYQIGQIVSDNK